MKPHKSKEYLAFVHRKHANTECVKCDEMRWQELHHYGKDGGAGMRPSDHVVVRLCSRCHHRDSRKLRALLNAGDHEQACDYLMDSLETLSAWAASLEDIAKRPKPKRCAGCDHNDHGDCQAQCSHHEPDDECARDELVEWIAQYDGKDLEAAEQWLLFWANRRAGNVMHTMAEYLSAIMEAETLDDARFIASRAGIATGLKAMMEEINE